MDRLLNVSMSDTDRLCRIARALSSPDRIRLLEFLEQKSCNVNELASSLGLPASSAGLHVRILEEAGLISTRQQPGEHGSSKICGKSCDLVTLRLQKLPAASAGLKSVSMPVGAFTDCRIRPTCGLTGASGPIGLSDDPRSFYLPERINAQLLWSSGGYAEYRFPNSLPRGSRLRKIIFSAEVCSEAPNYRESWKSDLTVWINGAECGTWTCPGDFGSRRGLLTPSCVPAGSTQYGLLTTWTVDASGSFVNELPVPGASLDALRIREQDYIPVRIGNREDAAFPGGFNLFGRGAGDYPQDLTLTLEYE